MLGQKVIILYFAEPTWILQKMTKTLIRGWTNWQSKFKDWFYANKCIVLTAIISPPTDETGGDYRFALCLSFCLSVRQSVCLSHSFSGLFLAMLSDIWMKVGSKLLYEDLQIRFDFRHGWPTFPWVIALCSKYVFRTFLGYAFTYLNESW